MAKDDENQCWKHLKWGMAKDDEDQCWKHLKWGMAKDDENQWPDKVINEGK